MEKHLTVPADGTLERVCADLRAIRQPANIVLAYGKPADSLTYLGLHMAFTGIARNKPVVFLDGANSFDPFLISKIARKAGLVPGELLDRIHISRAFTCHQMEALVVERLANALRAFNTNVAIISGLLDTFYDQDVSSGEAYALLKSTTAAFVRIAGRGARILIVCPDTHLPLESRQKRFVNHLKKISNKVLKSEGRNGETLLTMEKPHRRHYGLLEPPEFKQHLRWR